MKRVVAIAVLLCGCRYRFDELSGDGLGGDGGSGGRDGSSTTLDATPQLLECDLGVKLVDAPDAAAPGLTAAVTPSGIVAAWLTDEGRVGAAVVDVPAVDSAVAVRVSADLLGSPTGSWVTVGIAANDETVLVVARGSATAGGFTAFAPFDTQLIGATATRGITLALADPEAVTMLPTRDDFAMAAPSNGDLTAVARMVAGDNAWASDIQGLGSHARRALLGLDQRVVLTAATTANTCEARVADLVAGTSGTPQTWGGSPCVSAPAAAVPGTGELIVARSTGGQIRYAFGTVSALSLSIGAETATMYSGSEPRLTATPAGFWTARDASDVLFVDHFERTGVTVGAARVPGDLPLTAGHDIVSRGDVAYAVWLDAGLWIARMCP